MEDEALRYIHNYFGSYKQSNDIRFAEDGEPEKIANTVLKSPVLINERSTYVDLNFSGPAIDYCSPYTYFDSGKTVLLGYKDNNLVVPQVESFGLTLNQMTRGSHGERYFEHVHEFPRLLLNLKESDVVDVKAPFSTKQILRGETIGKAFVTKMPVVGNLDLFSLIINKLHFQRTIMPPFTIERVNGYLQNGAIFPGVNKRCLRESTISLSVTIPANLQNLDETSVRILQSWIVSQINTIQNTLVKYESEFNFINGNTERELIAIITDARNSNIVAHQTDIKKLSQQQDFNRLLNDF